MLLKIHRRRRAVRHFAGFSSKPRESDSVLELVGQRCRRQLDYLLSFLLQALQFQLCHQGHRCRSRARRRPTVRRQDLLELPQQLHSFVIYQRCPMNQCPLPMYCCPSSKYLQHSYLMMSSFMHRKTYLHCLQFRPFSF